MKEQDPDSSRQGRPPEPPEEPPRDGRRTGNGLERYGRYRVPRRQEPLRPDLQLSEIRRGLKPGSRYVRITPSSQQKLRRIEPAHLQATAVLLRPHSLAGALWTGVRRVLVGSPLASSQAIHERLDKVRALAIFSADAISSTAYATQEILLVLVLAGSGALGASLPIATVIAALIIVVAFSYRQTVRAYPSGGGSYTVARENLGALAGLTAAAALMVDYVLTVAVSVSAAVAAVTSAAPDLYDERLVLAIAGVWIVVLGNLRGVRESGTLFAIPTYLFMASFVAMLVTGFARYAAGAEIHPSTPGVGAATTSLGVLLVLRAFASGCSALTGLETVANGVPAFKPPESKNAATTMAWMAAILATFFIGATVLAHLFRVTPSEQPTVISQIAKDAFSGTPPYYVVQATTMLVLLMATNSSFAGFPRLASVMAHDGFLPRHMMFRGDRLAFSAGIMLLGILASALIFVYTADTHRLIPLYAVGVFISFTLSQSGMVVHWLRSQARGRHYSMVINGIGATGTAVVVVIAGGTKFTHGAWIVLLAIPILVTMCVQIGRHYQRVRSQLELREGDLDELQNMPVGGSYQTVIVPVEGLDRAVLRTIEYARSLSQNVTAVHITDDVQEAETLREQWEEAIPDVPIVIVESPYRALVAPFLAYVDAVDRANPKGRITVVLPEFVPAHLWQNLLHNQPAARLRRALMRRPNTAVVNVLYHLR
jgi:amino acid transporter